MRSKNEIPNKFDFMKQQSFNFLLNEKYFSDVVHEKNAKTLKRESASVSEQANPIVATSEEIKQVQTCNKLDYDRIFKEKRDKEVHTGIITETKTDYTGSTPKRYTSRCFIKPKAYPIWYHESVVLHINSTKKRYQEKIYFKNEVLPFRWIEHMVTEVKQDMKRKESPVPQDKTDLHYTSHDPEKNM